MPLHSQPFNPGQLRLMIITLSKFISKGEKYITFEWEKVGMKHLIVLRTVFNRIEEQGQSSKEKTEQFGQSHATSPKVFI
jgi:hypothetical protein